MVMYTLLTGRVTILCQLLSQYCLELPQPFRCFPGLDCKFVSVTSPELRATSHDLKAIGGGVIKGKRKTFAISGSLWGGVFHLWPWQ